MIILGDFAYELTDDGGNKGISFFNKLSTISSKVPLLLINGNHDL